MVLRRGLWEVAPCSWEEYELERRTLGSGGDASAVLAQWARRWRDPLVMSALAWTRDRDEAEDMVQEALARAIAIVRSDPEALDEVKSPYGWLAGITRNVTRDALRKQARRARLLRENESEVRNQLHALPDPDWDVNWLCECVVDAAERILTNKQLRILRGTLRGESDAQIAHREGVARSTVRWHRREAARSIRKYISLGRKGNDRTPRLTG